MPSIEELYQDIILEHNKRPRNFGPLEDATCQADGLNPLCGDELQVTLKLEGDCIAQVHFLRSLNELRACLVRELGCAAEDALPDFIGGKVPPPSTMPCRSPHPSSPRLGPYTSKCTLPALFGVGCGYSDKLRSLVINDMYLNILVIISKDFVN